MELLLDNPEVGILRDEEMNKVLASEHKDQIRRKKWILYSLLLSVLERAFLTLHSAPRGLFRSQWPGWEGWGLDYLQRDECRRVWNAIGRNLDTTFYDYMSARLSERLEEKRLADQLEEKRLAAMHTD